MEKKLRNLLANLNLNNCSGVYLVRWGEEILLDYDGEYGTGIDLECIESCTMDGAVDYLMGCFE